MLFLSILSSDPSSNLLLVNLHVIHLESVASLKGDCHLIRVACFVVGLLQIVANLCTFCFSSQTVFLLLFA